MACGGTGGTPVLGSESSVLDHLAYDAEPSLDKTQHRGESHAVANYEGLSPRCADVLVLLAVSSNDESFCGDTMHSHKAVNSRFGVDGNIWITLPRQSLEQCCSARLGMRVSLRTIVISGKRASE
jgi:hypothetical protein